MDALGVIMDSGFNDPKDLFGNVCRQLKISSSSPDRGVVIGGSENGKSRGKRLIDSEMAGPIAMKLSGIDRGNSVTVLGQRN